MSKPLNTVGPVIARRNVESAGALIGYLPVGFPNLDASVEAAVALVENGVDVLELGFPYSDPVMDGKVIQEATKHSLSNGFRLAHGIDAIHRIAELVDAPILVMSYWNPILQYGLERFANDLEAAGGAGIITPDLIPDEAADWLEISNRTGLDRVFLAAPSSSEARLHRVVQASRGFVYTVSTMGITGARADIDSAARALVGRLAEAGAGEGGAIARCVGIGISTADQVREVLGYAEGAIVGSAIVRALGDGGVSAAAALAKSLSTGTQN